MRSRAKFERLITASVGALLAIGGCGPVAASTDGRNVETSSPPRGVIGSAITLPSSIDSRTMLVLESVQISEPAPEADQTPVAQAVGPTVVAYDRPDEAAAALETFDNPTRPGVPLVFQAIDLSTEGWVEVLLPIRPNGSTGWIRSDDVSITYNPYRIDIDVESYELTVFRDGDEIMTTVIAIGTGDTPTPVGNFYLIELLRTNDESGPYGPFAYGLSGYSETLTTFNGGEGIIGIHGTNRPDLLGTDVSHGCIRVPNDVIVSMTDYLPLGTPITIG